MNMKLHETLTVLWENNAIVREIPPEITNNLNPNFELRPYQKESFARFVYYMNCYVNRQTHAHLLFHMATGSGKTLIMAGLILYLYSKGYRNFLFFVNNTNIIEKTKNNFLNPLSIKYLFSDVINIGDKRIEVKEVENFQAANPENINITFSTIQGLHAHLNNPRENSLTYEDFEDKEIVMLSDEAHHINVTTKEATRLTKEEQEELESWEGTVNRIFNANEENLLLEFTATVDFSVPEIEQKYQDKIIFDYSLKQFRNDGYSKEVKVLQADLEPVERCLQAVLLNQYRLKVFEKNKLKIKPVILFKSRVIAESQQHQADFHKKIKELKPEDLSAIQSRSADKTISAIFEYLSANNITLENLVSELKEDFSEEKTISINSKEESEEKQIAVNTLEDPKNEHRAIFAVDKLNEGWDVLNLFDIVRLYDTRDAKDGKPGKTTISEAQLIGRGARYCPFKITRDDDAYMRKFDNDLKNEMRICEELFYHSAYNPKYIQELNSALIEIGMKPKTTRDVKLLIKKEFKETDFYQEAFLFLNDQKKFDRSEIFGLKSTRIEKVHQYDLKTGKVLISGAFEGRSSTGEGESIGKIFQLTDFGTHLVRKALNKIEFYRFSNLKKFLPNLKSVTEFIEKEEYLGKVQVEVFGTAEQLKDLTPEQKLGAAVKVLGQITEIISSEKTEYIGTLQFTAHLLQKKIEDKTLHIVYNETGDKEFGHSMNDANETDYHLNLKQKDWYVYNDCYGTSEEKLFVKYINNIYDGLKKKFDEIFLVRNERFFRIYNFSDGRAYEPDFVLYLVKNNGKNSFFIQAFIEPKGAQFFQQDKWKEDFLKELHTKHKIIPIRSDQDFTIWGMPFFHHDNPKWHEFISAFEEMING